MHSEISSMSRGAPYNQQSGLKSEEKSSLVMLHFYFIFISKLSRPVSRPKEVCEVNKRFPQETSAFGNFDFILHYT